MYKVTSILGFLCTSMALNVAAYQGSIQES